MKSIARSDLHCDFIDGLRGVAILLVLLNHWSNALLVDPYGWFLDDSAAWVATAPMGVVLFFIVSAFTLFLSSTARFPNERSPFRNFYLRRAFRILPLWWLTLLLEALVQGKSPLSHWCCFTLLFGFDLKHDHLLFPGWSLFVEETFYLFLPLLVSFFSTPKKALLGTAVFYGIRLLWLRMVRNVDLVQTNTFDVLFPLAHWYAFGLGILLYLLWKSQLWKAAFRPGWRGVSLAGFVGFVFLLRPALWGKGDDLYALFFCALIFISMDARNPIGWLMRRPVLQNFGVCCFSIYLLHSAFIRVAVWRVRAYVFDPWGINHWPNEVQLLITFPFLAFLFLGIGRLSFRALERPCIELGKSLISLLESRRAVKALRT